MELDWQWLILGHVAVDAFNQALEVATILELQVTVDAIDIACSKPHEWLFVSQLR